MCCHCYSLHTTLQKHAVIFHTLLLLFKTATVFSTARFDTNVIANDFQNIYFKKIFAVLCVVRDGHRGNINGEGLENEYIKYTSMKQETK